MTYILDNKHEHCTTYVSCLRVERDLCVIYILDMVATCELQFCIVGSVM